MECAPFISIALMMTIEPLAYWVAKTDPIIAPHFVPRLVSGAPLGTQRHASALQAPHGRPEHNQQSVKQQWLAILSVAVGPSPW
jgi:hypothetical protein